MHMKNLIYYTKRTKMKKIELNLFKFLSLLFFALTIQNVSAINNDKPTKLFSTIACNDTVEISMNFDCEAKVTPDQLLEGNYPDMTIFVVNIIDQNGASIGDELDKNYVGQTLIAEVLDTTTTNKCWSHIRVVDKVAPVLDCNEMYTTCYKDPLPGSSLPHNFRFAYKLGYDIPDGDTLKQELEVGVVPGAEITDLNVKLNISHENLIDLKAFLVSPQNDTVVLFDNLTCGEENMEVELDDEADKTAADLSAECCPCDPAISGKFKSIDVLSIYDGGSPTGTWVLNVIDKNQGNLGKLDYVALLFKQNHGFVNFPIPTTSSTPIKTGEREYLVKSGFDPCGEVKLSYIDSIQDLNCSTNYTSHISRKWAAEDESGNISTCVQDIWVIRTGTSFLVFPRNYDGIDLPPLSCNNPNQNTGEPGDELCNMVTISHKDDTIDVCSGSYKVIRHWKVSEMCSAEVKEHDQLIAVLDTEGPVLSGLANHNIEANSLECSADITVEFPDVISDCSDFDLMTYELGYQLLDDSGNPTTNELLTDNLKKINDKKYILEGATIGKIKFTYTVTDDCGNSTIKTNRYTIYDNSAPSVVCDEHTQINVGVDGTARAPAIVFDDGSNDNCSDITFKVRRMNTNCDSRNINFRDTISFCCEDIGTTQMVEMQVTDASGHKNSCMVEVNVFDKIPPVIKCPKPISIECDQDYLNTDLVGYPTAYDNCNVTLTPTDTILHINQCNVGWVEKRWEATDGRLKSYCSQIITINDSEYNKFHGKDIIWPKDKLLTDCVDNFNPSITGDIAFRNEDFCSMVAARFKDDTFNVIEGACTKILRHWEVIDWCNFDENPEESTWNHTQVIMLNNTVAPTFDETCSNQTFLTYGKCKGNVNYTKTATDDCTKEEDLYWTYLIDFDNDGTWDTKPVHSNTIDQIFDNGIYRVAWTVEDGCGNQTKCEEIFTVKDGKNPTPLCITELTTVVMNYVGMVTICAEDFNLGTNCYNCNTGSYDNCTPKEDLIYSFSTDTSEHCRTYTCDSIPNGVQVQKTLQMWVTDEAGNQDFCTVLINIEDNEASICKDTTVGSIIDGFVFDPKKNPLRTVKLSMEGNEGAIATTYTNANGEYAFNNLDENSNYTMKTDIDTKYVFGVTTLDIVLIQKHLLGVKKFKKPYQFIAADVNNSKTVSANDILRIRKLILGETPNFGATSADSWVFTEDNDDIKNNINILSTWNKHDFEITPESFGKSNNLVGIKIGDVNCNSANLLKANGIVFRNNSFASLTTKNQNAIKNQDINVSFSFDNSKNIEGAQFTLNFDTDKLIFTDILLNDELINKNNIGLSNISNGYITVSWTNNSNISNSELFNVIFRAKKSGTISKMISLSSDITPIEAYNSELETMNIKLDFRDNIEINANYALYQNTPNPFNNETTILFDLPTNQEASISFYDVTGRTIKTISKEFNKGRNTITVSFDQLTSGVIYYTLETEEYTATKKMINLK